LAVIATDLTVAPENGDDPVPRRRANAVRVGLFLMWVALSFGRAGAASLAVVPGDATAAQHGDLLAVELAALPGAQLVERAEIDRIAREQALAVADPDNAARLGKLVGADGLVQVTTTGGLVKNLLQVRVTAVRPGVTLALWRFAMPGNAGAADWAKSAAQAVKELLPKLENRTAPVTPLSFGHFQSPLSSRLAVAKERDLNALFFHAMVNQPDFVLLEREKLTQAEIERHLASGDQAFWTGAFLIDGVINPSGESGQDTTVEIRITPPSGVDPIKGVVRGDPGNPAALAESFVAEVRRLLGSGSPIVRWKPEEESARHAARAEWALRWGMWNEALAFSDSAWALGTKDLATAALRHNAMAGLMQRQSSVTYMDQNVIGALVRYTPEPDPAALEAGLAGVSLAKESMLLFPEALSNRSFRAGLVVFLQSSSGLLGRYYSQSYARQGREEKLAAFRLGLREVVEAVFQSPEFRPVLAAAPSPVEALPPGPKGWSKELAPVFGVLVQATPVWSETPREGAAMLRKLLQNPAISSGKSAWIRNGDFRPRLYGWTWDARSQAEAEWSGLLRAMNDSKNPYEKLSGLALWMRFPANRDDFDEACGAMVSYLEQGAGGVESIPVPLEFELDFDAIIRGKGNSGRAGEQLKALSRMGAEMDRSIMSVVEAPPGAVVFVDELAALRQMLKEGKMPSPETVQALRSSQSPGKARELIELLAAFNEKYPSGRETVKLRQAIFIKTAEAHRLLAKSAPPPKAKDQVGPPAPAVAVTARFFAPLSIDEVVTNSSVRGVVLNAGQLWFDLNHVGVHAVNGPGGGVSRIDYHRRCVAGFSLASGEWVVDKGEEIPSDKTLEWRLGSLADSKEAMAIAGGKVLQMHFEMASIYDVASRAFSRVKLPLQQPYCHAVGDRVFLFNAAEIVETDAELRRFKILASTRRQPPVQPMENGRDFGDLDIFSPDGARVMARIRDVVYLLGADGDWTVFTNLEADGAVVKGPEGVLLSTGRPLASSLSFVGPGMSAPELLWRSATQQFRPRPLPFGHPLSRPAAAAPTASPKFAQTLSWHSLLPHGRSILGLAVAAQPPGGGPDHPQVPGAFNELGMLDDASGKMLRLRLELPAWPRTSGPPPRLGLLPRNSHMLHTPRGLVVWNDNVVGFWLVDPKEMARAFELASKQPVNP